MEMEIDHWSWTLKSTWKLVNALEIGRTVHWLIPERAENQVGVY